ncbi:rnst-2 [Pristionchus pacificus]|uniref:Uncharacterized protein n=1 Tax=Pristionchus pacificus TaxID=54126 RepID=A0A2A6BZX8_PRIPA|nr:rnst-2 [Pristionchus pacificus]|eukprot:PDM71562.1 hypothetical protein PRIPAC_37969 [Pristionchus pacificus]
MRLLLLLALVGVSTTMGVFRREEMSKFREKNEEKVKQIILEAEAGNSSTSSGSGERSDLAGMKRDPDDSIQKAAVAHQKQRDDEAKRREEAQDKLGDMLEQELKEGVQGTTGTAGTKALLGEMKMGRAPFDYLMFTMIYPTATCMADDDQVPGSCEIPTGTAEWTIHGLWPNFADGSYPQFCDHQKFDEKQVQALHEQMRTKWPNLFPKTPEAQLWSHEWEKHGTCSKSDPLLDSQFKYFNMSLFLLDHVDLRTRMEQKGISPRTAPYERDTLQKTLDELIGHHVQMYCLNDKKTHESLLADIRVCMDAELKPMDCPKADIQPYVRAGTVTPVDHQPLPVPRACSESVYYVAAGTDISKSIDVFPPGKDGETGKKLGTEEKDDYYDDDEDETKKRNKEEDEKAHKLEAELMDALTFKTEQYQENLRKHVVASSTHGDSFFADLKLPKDEMSARNWAKVTEMARQFQQSRVRGELRDVEVAAPISQKIDRPTFLFVGIAVLSTYLIVIVGFFCANKSGRQSYGRLQHA